MSSLCGIEMINLVSEVWKSLSSLSQLLARLPVINRWEGFGLVSGDLLTSKDLITPVLLYHRPSWVWCWSLRGPSTLETHSTGILLPAPRPVDGTLVAWLMPARGLCASLILSASGLRNACHHPPYFHTYCEGSWDCNYVQSVCPLSCSPISVLGTFCFCFLFLF